MFNNLDNANNQNRQEVDDIFAETDNQKHQSADVSGIETRRVGLSSNAVRAEAPVEKSGGGKILKIVLILVIVSIVGLGGYLVYNKLAKNSANTAEINNEAISSTVPSGPAASNIANNSEETGSIVTPASEQNNSSVSGADSTGTTDNQTGIPLIPGVNTPAEEATTTIVEPVILNVDSDLDGISDAEEKTVGSNPNVIDSDNDGLSDYEEIRVYKTNPINYDSDGDTYSDGSEVRNGYNPNGAGKMPGSLTQ